MNIRFGYEIAYDLPAPADLVLLLHLRPELDHRLLAPQILRHNAAGAADLFIDHFGNRATRLHAPAGTLVLSMDSVCAHSGRLDDAAPDAPQHPVADLPHDVLPYLLPSRYCENDRLGAFAWARFGSIPTGWDRVQAICDYVHDHLRFDYLQARATRTAVEAWEERVGVCRDFTHLALTLCRCLNIPARYSTGYLGDIGVPRDPAPMDFSAWFEVWLGGRWFTFDARHNRRRIGRLVMAYGRDAADCALTISFGPHTLKKFHVITEEVASPAPPLAAA
jgi:transglutaminase-like putative cysteine protease